MAHLKEGNVDKVAFTEFREHGSIIVDLKVRQIFGPLLSVFLSFVLVIILGHAIFYSSFLFYFE